MLNVARTDRPPRPRGNSVRRAVAGVLVCAFALVAVEAAPHHDSTCDHHGSHHPCSICVVAHAPGLPASPPPIVASVRRPAGRPAARPAPRVRSDASRGAVTPRSPPRAS
jgi:hypothetical protein